MVRSNILKIVSKDITPEQFKDTFETNIFGMFFLSQVAVPYLSDNDTIINTTSVTAYRGSGHLIDYASTKGAIVSFYTFTSNHTNGEKYSS